ncbi:hypothetical protein PSEUDO8O_30518 [Pseudomonas sp. 8O]|nr:hypothetical protein PSEUDO8O_30518 [Pseudomonas sp. 8O]
MLSHISSTHHIRWHSDSQPQGKGERLMNTIPLTDTIVHALAQLVDDSGNNGNYREPSHADIEFQVNTAGLSKHDPKQQGQTIGKAKRNNWRNNCETIETIGD